MKITLESLKFDYFITYYLHLLWEEQEFFCVSQTLTQIPVITHNYHDKNFKIVRHYKIMLYNFKYYFSNLKFFSIAKFCFLPLKFCFNLF